MPRNEHFLPRNNGNRSESIPRNFFGTKFRSQPYAGAETTVFESRPYMDRNNVLKLWTFVMEDLKNLGAKKFCPNLGN